MPSGRATGAFYVEAKPSAEHWTPVPGAYPDLETARARASEVASNLRCEARVVEDQTGRPRFKVGRPWDGRTSRERRS